MIFKTESIYRIPLKVSGYMDHYWENTWKIGFRTEEELLQALNVLSKHISKNYETTKYNVEEGDEISTTFKLVDDHTVSTVYIPCDIMDKVYKETLIKERIDLNQINRKVKLKKLKERSKLCTE